MTKLIDLFEQLSDKDLDHLIPTNGSVTFGIKDDKVAFIKYRKSNDIKKIVEEEEING